MDVLSITDAISSTSSWAPGIGSWIRLYLITSVITRATHPTTATMETQAIFSVINCTTFSKAFIRTPGSFVVSDQSDFFAKELGYRDGEKPGGTPTSLPYFD